MFIEWVDKTSDSPYQGLMLVLFGFILLGLRARANKWGGDVALIVLNVAVGFAWGK